MADSSVSEPQPPLNPKKVYLLGDKVTFACWSKACKAAEGVKAQRPHKDIPGKMVDVILGPQREYTIEAFQATGNAKSAFAKGHCPVCNGKMSRIVTIQPQAAEAKVDVSQSLPASN